MEPLRAKSAFQYVLFAKNIDFFFLMWISYGFFFYMDNITQFLWLWGHLGVKSEDSDN